MKSCDNDLLLYSLFYSVEFFFHTLPSGVRCGTIVPYCADRHREDVVYYCGGRR
jgi:hypothetical protein